MKPFMLYPVVVSPVDAHNKPFTLALAPDTYTCTSMGIVSVKEGLSWWPRSKKRKYLVVKAMDIFKNLDGKLGVMVPGTMELRDRGFMSNNTQLVPSHRYITDAVNRYVRGRNPECYITTPMDTAGRDAEEALMAKLKAWVSEALRNGHTVQYLYRVPDTGIFI